MFFKKRKPTPDAAAAFRNQRSEYRKQIAKASLFEANLRSPGLKPLRVELVDLSVRGAGVRLAAPVDRTLQRGDTFELALAAMMRDEISILARIVGIRPEGQGLLRLGFEFVHPDQVAEKLDNYYLRHFNRRRDVRVSPSMDRRIPALLRIGGAEIRGVVGDLSESGACVFVPLVESPRLEGHDVAEVEFKLPGSASAYALRVRIRHRSRTKEREAVGMEFDRDDERLDRILEELRSFVKRRADEMALWDKHGG